MTTPSAVARRYGPDVHEITLGERHVLLIGTAHISQESVDLVQHVIREELPDGVCLELDRNRYEALSKNDNGQSLDLKKVIRNRQLSTLLVSLLMGWYQKKLGSRLGIRPGAELLAAADTAKAHGIPVSMCDRDIRITLRRTWESISAFKKAYLLSSLFASIFDSVELSPEKLEEMKKKDVLSSLMDDMGRSFPELKRVLIDERDVYLAERIKETRGMRLVAVVGAGHVEGILRAITQDHGQRLHEIMTSPPVVVREFDSVREDISSFTGWWKNILFHVFLVFFFTGFGSAIGTWVGGYEIFKNLVG